MDNNTLYSAHIKAVEAQVHTRLAPSGEYITYGDFVDLYARLFKAALRSDDFRILREVTYPGLQPGWRQRLVPHAPLFPNSATYTKYPNLASRAGSSAVLPDPAFFVPVAAVCPLGAHVGVGPPQVFPVINAPVNNQGNGVTAPPPPPPVPPPAQQALPVVPPGQVQQTEQAQQAHEHPAHQAHQAPSFAMVDAMFV